MPPIDVLIGTRAQSLIGDVSRRLSPMPDRDYDDSGHHLFESIISSPQHSTELTCESLGRVGPVFLVVHVLKLSDDP
jgi:hypothetical protein